MRIYPDTGGRLCHALHTLTNPLDTQALWQSQTPLPHCVLHFLHLSRIPHKVTIHISLTMTLSLTLSFELYQTSFFLDQELFLPLISFNTQILSCHHKTWIRACSSRAHPGVTAELPDIDSCHSLLSRATCPSPAKL